MAIRGVDSNNNNRLIYTHGVQRLSLSLPAAHESICARGNHARQVSTQFLMRESLSCGAAVYVEKLQIWRACENKERSDASYITSRERERERADLMYCLGFLFLPRRTRTVDYAGMA
jgi:hypothetical protein